MVNYGYLMKRKVACNAADPRNSTLVNYFVVSVGKMEMSSHLVTGDLLILSGSSVTLKEKTNVSVRISSSCFHTNPPHFLFFLNALISSRAMPVSTRQIITTQTRKLIFQSHMDHHWPTLTTPGHWMDVRPQNVKVTNKTNEKVKQM